MDYTEYESKQMDVLSRKRKHNNLIAQLAQKLDEICADKELVKAILFLLETDEERQVLLDIVEAGGEEASPKNLAYTAINIDDKRKLYHKDQL